MIQTKIFSAFEIAKKADCLTKGYKEKAINDILEEVKKDPTNLNDAYVILDFMKSVSSHILDAIHEDTVNNVVQNGDNEGLGVQLVVERTKVFDFEKDREWLETTKKIGIFTDAQKKREKTIQDAVIANLEDNKPPGIPFTNKLTIVTRALN